jgi:hypothetical protein
MGSGFHIFCGKCDESVKVLTQVRADEKVICPSCRQTDTLEEALRICKEHDSKSLMEGLDSILRKPVSDGSNGAKSGASKRASRWYFVPA